MKKKDYKNMTKQELWAEILRTIKETGKFTKKNRERFTELVLTWKKKWIEEKLKNHGIRAKVEVINKND